MTWRHELDDCAGGQGKHRKLNIAPITYGSVH